MVKISKKVVTAPPTRGSSSKDDQEFLYINLLDFKDKDEQEEIYFMIKDMLEELE